jgi:NADH-quinone oxidoreductase subunit M
MIPFALIQSIIIPIFASFIIFAFGSRLKGAGWIALASLLYTSFLLFLIGVNLFVGGSAIREDYVWAAVAGLKFGFVADTLSLPVALMISVVCACASIYSLPYMERRVKSLFGDGNERQLSIYYGNFLLIAAGLIGVTLSTNLIELYLFVELMLMPTFFLISLFGYVEKERVAITYFIWNHIGAFLFLAGIILVFVASGSFEINSLSSIQASSIAYWIVALILIGWLVKLAVIGVHMWLPVTEAEPPTSIAPIMAIVSGVGIYVLVRLLILGMPIAFQPFGLPLMMIALITMFYGGIVTLAQTDVKYIYAWSTVSQNAYSLLGIGSFTLLGVSGGVFYFLSHIMGKFVLFSVAGILLTQTGIRDTKQMGGLAAKMPITATICLLGSLILSAVPPLIGFQAEWIMFTGIFLQGVSGNLVNLVVPFLGIIATLLTVAYTLWPFRRIFFGPLPSSMEAVSEAPVTMTVPLLVILAIAIVIGIYPDFIFKLLASYMTGLPVLGGS